MHSRPDPFGLEGVKVMKVLKALERVDLFLAKVLGWIVGFVLYAMMLLVFINVIFRYFLNRPIVWAEEVSVLMLVFTALFGSYVGMVDRRMARITAIVNKVPMPWKKALNLLAQLFIVYLLVFLVVFGIQFVLTPYMLTQKTATLRFPMWIFYSFVPIASGLMLFHMILDIFRYFLLGEFSMDDDSNVEEVN